MTRLVFQVAVGPSRPLWEKCLTSMATYCTRHGLRHSVLREPVLRIVPKASQRSDGALRLGYLPIFEKFNAFRLLEECDEIAVIDADVWAMPGAANIFDAVPPEADYAAAVERDMPITPAYARKLNGYATGQYGDPQFRFRNCGVEVLRRSILRFVDEQNPADFIHRPEFARFVNGEGHYRWATEQTLKNIWLRDAGVHTFNLPWIWNALYGALTTLEGAQLVHLFLSEHLNGHDPVEMIRNGNARARV